MKLAVSALQMCGGKHNFPLICNFWKVKELEPSVSNVV